MEPDEDAGGLSQLDSMRERVATYRQYVAEVIGIMARSRAEVHTGTDEAGAVTAQVDGQGLVVGIALSRAAVRLDSRGLGVAVMAALRAAEQGRTEALLTLGSRIPAPGAVR